MHPLQAQNRKPRIASPESQAQNRKPREDQPEWGSWQPDEMTRPQDGELRIPAYSQSHTVVDSGFSTGR